MSSGSRKERTLEKILGAFAESVEAREFEEAEGWIAVARWFQDRAEASEPVLTR